MKKILLVICFFILSLGVAQASTPEIGKETIPVIIVNNAYSDARLSFAKTKSELPPILINQITKSLESKYTVKQIDNTFNILDVASTEKADILDMFKDSNYSTIILVEILPVITRPYADFDSIHIKILDIVSKKYLYNGKLWSEKQLPQSALNDMSPKLDTILKGTFKI